MSLTGYNPYTYTRGFRNQEFHHVVLSVSGTVHTLYLDGSMVVQNVAAGNVFASYQTITNTVIGAQTTLSQAFQGTIGDVRVYNYAIPATTVTSLYRDRELIVYYPFDTSVNALTPNYATLIYDASLIGQPLITASAGANVGSGALALSNTAGEVATQYVKTTPGIVGQIGWTPDVTHGITIACWVNVAGVAGRIQRIFDIPLTVGTKGLAVDISGTNMLYSGWNAPPILTNAYVYLPLTTNTTNIGTNADAVTTVGTVPFSTFNAKAAASFSGNSLVGGSNYLTVPMNIANFTNLTFGYWIYANNSGSYDPASIAQTQMNNNPFFQPDITGTNITANATLPAPWVSVSFAISYATTWTHVVYTVSQTSPYLVQMYINGILRASNNGTNSVREANIPNCFVIGRSGDNYRGYNGGLRHFFAFNSILTTSEIQSIYTATI